MPRPLHRLHPGQQGRVILRQLRGDAPQAAPQPPATPALGWTATPSPVLAVVLPSRRDTIARFPLTAAAANDCYDLAP